MLAPNPFASHTTVDSLQLRRHTVRIGHPDGDRLLGTGFFVAPGWVLTAAHVGYLEYDQQELATVTVRPSDPTIGTSAVVADVVVRTAPSEGTAIWPFPDVAILRLRPEAEWVDRHPCVWLGERDPSRD